MPERFKVTRSSADLGAAGQGSAGDLRARNGRQHDEEAATGLLPQRNYRGEFLSLWCL